MCNRSAAHTHNNPKYILFQNILAAFWHLKLVVAYFLHYLIEDSHPQNQVIGHVKDVKHYVR